MAAQIASVVRGFIQENFLYDEDASLREDTSLLDAGLVDSTGILELVTFLEARFSIRIRDHEMIPENLDSIARISTYVQRRQNEMAGVAHEN